MIPPLSPNDRNPPSVPLPFYLPVILVKSNHRHPSSLGDERYPHNLVLRERMLDECERLDFRVRHREVDRERPGREVGFG